MPQNIISDCKWSSCCTGSSMWGFPTIMSDMVDLKLVFGLVEVPQKSDWISLNFSFLWLIINGMSGLCLHEGNCVNVRFVLFYCLRSITTAGSENICKMNPESADTQHRMWLISQVYRFFVKDVRLRVAVTSLTAENSAWPMEINMAAKFARGGVGRGRVSVTSERSRNWLNVGIKIYCWLKWVNGQR